jgi:hypothetical protein
MNTAKLMRIIAALALPVPFNALADQSVQTRMGINAILRFKVEIHPTTVPRIRSIYWPRRFCF